METTVVITGDARGIGEGIRNIFRSKDVFYNIIGVDLDYKDPSITSTRYQVDPTYVRYQGDIKNVIINDSDLKGDIVLINNAGVQNRCTDIENNLIATIDFTERLIKQVRELKNAQFVSILFNTSASSLTGFEFPRYAASKAGLNAYMKNVACRLAPDATVNAIALGGVYTDLNNPVTDDRALWNQIMKITPLKKWTHVEEVGEWAYFLTMVNFSASGQVFLVDNGEKDLNNTFVWPDFDNEAAIAETNAVKNNSKLQRFREDSN